MQLGKTLLNSGNLLITFIFCFIHFLKMYILTTSCSETFLKFKKKCFMTEILCELLEILFAIF